MINFKDIHIGGLIEIKWRELSISMDRTISFFKCTEKEILHMFKQEVMATDHLLKWSKLLEYDFFRLYSQHLILYSPPSRNSQKEKSKTSALPYFKKNLYTQEIIYFLLELLNTGKKTRQEIMNEYKIPKTTLYKWIIKYGKH